MCGCIDKVVYLFSLGLGNDVWIIMCILLEDLFNNIYLVIYEVGYVCYE